MLQHRWRLCRCLQKYYGEEQIRELSRMLDLGSQSFDTFSLDWYSDEINPQWGVSPRENMEGVYETCVYYATHFGKNSDNLLLTGAPGLGKTFLSAAIAREVSDEICEATGADGVSCVGSKFVIYRFSEKCQEERNQTGRAKRREVKVNPVRKGAQARRQAARKVREQRNEYFRQQALERAIERSREKKLREQD